LFSLLASELTLAGDDGGARPGTGSWKPSLNWPTPRPRGRSTDRERSAAGALIEF
jgi:hypothetical protein